MDKIDRSEFIGKSWLLDKLDELVNGYNETYKRLDDIDDAMVGIMEWINKQIHDDNGGAGSR